jgi:hypothetical protein
LHLTSHNNQRENNDKSDEIWFTWPFRSYRYTHTQHILQQTIFHRTNLDVVSFLETSLWYIPEQKQLHSYTQYTHTEISIKNQNHPNWLFLIHFLISLSSYKQKVLKIQTVLETLYLNFIRIIVMIYCNITKVKVIS